MNGIFLNKAVHKEQILKKMKKIKCYSKVNLKKK